MSPSTSPSSSDEHGEGEPRSSRRWPHWVYDQGSEPDYRFSFANERTFLAWIRTSLALLAAAVALDVVDLSMPERAQRALAWTLVTTGMWVAAASWVRWARSERAMRRKEPLPTFGASFMIAAVLTIASAVLLAVAV